MAPSMAAVLRAPGKLCSFSYVLFVFLLFYMLDVVSITVYDRDTLLNIGSSIAQRKSYFEFLNAGGLFTDTASEPFVWAARPRKRRRKRGTRAGVLVRLRYQRETGVSFYINNSWSDERNIHAIKSFCSPDLEFHMLLCRQFWLPREFTAIIIRAVYILSRANTDQALRELYGNISEQETVHPDAGFVVTGGL